MSMKLTSFLFTLLFPCFVFSQDVFVLLKEASNLEREQKENEAILKYADVLTVDSTNKKALLKTVELLVASSYRDEKKAPQKAKAEKAFEFANKYFTIDSTSSDAFYIQALASYCLAKTDIENKIKYELFRTAYLNSKKSLEINPNHTRANYVYGKWHFDMENQTDLKRVSKILYGGLQKSDIDTAIFYMEKCKIIDPYYMLNYLELAKAYQLINRPAQASELLNKILRLPIRTADDEKWKAEAKKLLEQ